MTTDSLTRLSPPRELLEALTAEALLEQLAPPVLPSADDLAAAVSAFETPRTVQQVEHWADSGLGMYTSEGRTFRLELGLGTIALRSFDAARVERALAREVAIRQREVDLRTQVLLDVQAWDFDAHHWMLSVSALRAMDEARGRTITEWSGKSRARMIRTFASLDYTALLALAGDLGMVTLTYPGDWETVAPSGKVVKAHLSAFRKAWVRAFGKGSDLGLWKLEFQHRGAPHFHLLLSVPALMPDGGDVKLWLSLTWARIVGAVGEEAARHRVAGTAIDFGSSSRMTDHKRLAVYFLKHSTKASGDKEYQHVVPELWRTPETGPGRFWGFWGLDKPVELVDVDLVDFVQARRVLRRVTAARSRHIAYQRAVADGKTPARALNAKYPRPKNFGAGGSLSGGWLLTNDGVELALDVARYLRSRR